MGEHRLICLSRMTASILNLDTVLTSEFNMEQHERCCKIQIGIRANMLHHKFCSLLIDGMITLSIKQNNFRYKFLFWWSDNVFFEHYFGLKPCNKYVGHVCYKAISQRNSVFFML